MAEEICEEGKVGKKRFLLVLIIMLLLLTGCKQKTTINFPRAQEWSIRTVADFKNDVIQGIGETAGNFLGVPISGGLFDTETLLKPVMNAMQKSYQEQGINFSWSYAADKLQFRASGNSFGQIAQTEPGSFSSLTQVGENTYRLYIDFTALGDDYSMISGYLYDSTVIINAGKIIESNADTQTRTSAIWENPTSIDVTFQPGSSTVLLPVLAGIGGLGILALLIKLISGSGQGLNCPICGKKNRFGSTECSGCGNWL